MKAKILLLSTALPLFACTTKKFNSSVPVGAKSPVDAQAAASGLNPSVETGEQNSGLKPKVETGSIEVKTLDPTETGVKQPPSDPNTPAPNPTPSSVPTNNPKPTDTSVEFGADDVFHIGDGAIGSGSACVGEVKTFALQGTRYSFEFEVLEDDTTVDLSIAKICGIDAEKMTSIALINSSDKAIEGSEQILATDAQSDRSKILLPYTGLKLKKGLHAVVITSKNTVGKPQGTKTPGADEYDDFIVGKIKLKANKAVKFSKIFAE